MAFYVDYGDFSSDTSYDQVHKYCHPNFWFIQNNCQIIETKIWYVLRPYMAVMKYSHGWVKSGWR